jgi:cell division protein FtsW
LLILAFTTAGLRIAIRAGDRFGGLLVIGIIMLISVQSFINIASIMGLFPLAGLPLTFVSQGGSALLVALAMSGIVLSVSRKIKTT